MIHLGNIASIRDHEYTKESLPTGIVSNGVFLKLCKHISLDYPVLESLSYSNHFVSNDTIVLVLSVVGRPRSFQEGKTWDGYDIVDIFADGHVYQCFRSSLSVITL